MKRFWRSEWAIIWPPFVCVARRIGGEVMVMARMVFIAAVGVVSSTLLLGATVPEQQSNGPILPPRESHPFGAIETRPLWDRPGAGAGVDGAPSLRSSPARIEADVD